MPYWRGMHVEDGECDLMLQGHAERLKAKGKFTCNRPDMIANLITTRLHADNANRVTSFLIGKLTKEQNEMDPRLLMTEQIDEVVLTPAILAGYYAEASNSIALRSAFWNAEFYRQDRRPS